MDNSTVIIPSKLYFYFITWARCSTVYVIKFNNGATNEFRQYCTTTGKLHVMNKWKENCRPIVQPRSLLVDIAASFNYVRTIDTTWSFGK